MTSPETDQPEGSADTQATADNPAGTGDVPETVGWTGLRQMVDTGVVRLDNGVAYDCASAVSDTYYAVTAIRSYAERESSPVFPISPLDEGPVFSRKLEKRTAEFVDLTDALLDRLTLRHETLVEAGKAFEEVDGASALDFGEVGLNGFDYEQPHLLSQANDAVDIDPLFSGDVHVPLPVRDPEDWDAWKGAYSDLLGLSTPLFSPALVNAYDDGEAVEAYGIMYGLGEHLRNNNIAEGLTAAASTWHQLGLQLSGAMQALRTEFGRLTEGAWEGDAPAQAAAVLTQDKIDTESVLPAIFAMRDLYSYLAYWMGETAKLMPTEPVVPMCDAPQSFFMVPTLRGDVPIGYDNKRVIDSGKIQDDLIEMQTYYTDRLFTADGSVPNFENLVAMMRAEGGGTDTTPPPWDTTSSDDDYPYDDSLYGNGVAPAGGDLGEYAYAADGQNTAGLVSSEEPIKALAVSARGATEEELAAAEVAEQQAQQQMAQQGMQAMQQGLNTAGQMIQDGLTAAQESLASTVTPGAVPMGGLPLIGDLSKSAGLPGLKGGAPGGGAPGGASSNPGHSSGPARPAMDAAKLFPRASLPAAGHTTQAGMPVSAASGSPMGGMPMAGAPGAGAGGGRGQGDDKHERAKYLDRVDNLDEALGDPVDMTRPVVGETPARSAAPDQAPIPGQRNRPPVQSHRLQAQSDGHGGQDQPVILPRTEGGV